MRKVTFIKDRAPLLKLMLYKAKDDVYLFGFDTFADASCTWDLWFDSVADANEYCQDTYELSEDDWIEVVDPCSNYKHDIIMPTLNGKEISNFEKVDSFGGLTGNERLFVSGLMEEFDRANENDKIKAVKILKALEFDDWAIGKIVT
jgi:hypothetical protein